jgi:hypothetical protein
MSSLTTVTGAALIPLAILEFASARLSNNLDVQVVKTLAAAILGGLGLYLLSQESNSEAPQNRDPLTNPAPRSTVPKAVKILGLGAAAIGLAAAVSLGTTAFVVGSIFLNRR